MFTRCFERETREGQIETVNISEYGFEWYINNVLVRAGLVEDLESDIKILKEEGFEEIK